MTPEIAAFIDRWDRRLRDWPNQAVPTNDVADILAALRGAEGRAADFESALRAYEQMRDAVAEDFGREVMAGRATIRRAQLVPGYIVIGETFLSDAADFFGETPREAIVAYLDRVVADRSNFPTSNEDTTRSARGGETRMTGDGGYGT